MRITSISVVEDRRRLHGRVGILRAAVITLFALLLGGFWYFQIFQHAKFREMAENNHQRTLPLRAPRGVIFDRHGEVLVENRASFNISIMREHSRDLDRTVRLLAEVVGGDEQEMRENLERHRREPTYRPVVMVQDASLAQVAAVTARRLDFELPDVVVQQVPTRRYPAQGLGAHLLGYVGEASEQQMGADGVPSGTVIGQSGLERTYNKRADGRGWRAPRRRQQRRSRDSPARQGGAGGGPPHPGDTRRRHAARRRGGLPPLRLLGLGRGARAEQRRRSDDGESAGLRPERVRVGDRPGDLAGAEHRRTASPAEPRHPGPVFARLDLQDRRRDGGDGRGRDDARDQGLLPGRGQFLRPLLQVPSGRRPRLGRPAPRHREVVQRLLLHRRQPARRRQDPRLGRAAGAGREDRHRPAQRGREHHAVHARGSSSATARSGTPARRSRSRSARARYRSRRCRWR